MQDHILVQVGKLIDVKLIFNTIVGKLSAIVQLRHSLIPAKAGIHLRLNPSP